MFCRRPGGISRVFQHELLRGKIILCFTREKTYKSESKILLQRKLVVFFFFLLPANIMFPPDHPLTPPSGTKIISLRWAERKTTKKIDIFNEIHAFIKCSSYSTRATITTLFDYCIHGHPKYSKYLVLCFFFSVSPDK